MANIVKENLPFYTPNYDPTTQRVQWFDQIPNASIRDPNFVWVALRGENTLPFLVSKNVTNFKKADLQQPGWSQEQINSFRDQGHGYDDVPKTGELFQSGGGPDRWVSAPGVPTVWPFIWNLSVFPTPPGATEPMSVEEGRIRGARYTSEYPVAVFETQEQAHAISTHWPFVRAWVEEWHKKIRARWPNRKILTSWNYFSALGQVVHFSNEQERLNYINAPVSSWAANPNLPGGELEKFTAVCFGAYFRDPESVKREGYNLIFNCYLTKKAGKEIIAFMQAVHEFLPNNNILWRVPGGKFYHMNKLRHAGGIGYAICSFARVWASAFIPFGFGGKETRPFKLDPAYHGGRGVWVPDGNAETQPGNLMSAPVWGGYDQGNEVFAMTGIEDMDGFAQWMWERSFGKVLNHDKEEWCSFRVDSETNWRVFDQTLAEGAIKGWYRDGYFVYARKKGNKYAFCVYNGKAADSKRHKVEWKIDNLTFETWISGTIPHYFYHEA